MYRRYELQVIELQFYGFKSQDAQNDDNTVKTNWNRNFFKKNLYGHVSMSIIRTYTGYRFLILITCAVREF